MSCDDPLLGVAAGHDICRGRARHPSCFPLDSPVQHAVVAPSQRGSALAQEIQLLPAEPVEIADGVVSGDHNGAE